MMDEVFIKTQQQKMQRDREAILIDKVLKFEILTGEGEKNATSSLSDAKHRERVGLACTRAYVKDVCPRQTPSECARSGTRHVVAPFRPVFPKDTTTVYLSVSFSCNRLRIHAPYFSPSLWTGRFRIMGSVGEI